jgi:hypothetical protein
MGAAVDKLTGLVGTQDCFDIPWSDLRPAQIAAVNERFQERIGAIKLLANRAEEGNIRSIRDRADIVPLLFAHTAYKSYPESWFTQGRWDRMGQWLDTITYHRVRGVDTKDVKDIDDWLECLDAAGHYVSCSSGTTGKCSMIPSSTADREFNKKSIVSSMAWATGIPANRQYKQFLLTPVPQNIRNIDSRLAIASAFAHTEIPFPGEPMTVGRVSRMVALRRSIADGTARPADIVWFEGTTKTREKALEDGLVTTAERIIAARGEPLLFMGFLFTMFRISEIVRSKGYSAKDFHPENAIISGGGLKGNLMPPDFREQIFGTFNMRPERVYQFYGMQEMNTIMPRCSAGRYHMLPWQLLLPLDQSGDNLLDFEKGEVEGRAAFFDLSLDGRWGGVITGDKVRVDHGKCACGHTGPHVADDIVRYADLPGGDKISCSGTIDAYIRGAA